MRTHRFLAAYSMWNFPNRKRLFEEIDTGRFILVMSAIIETEIEHGPEKTRLHFSCYEALAEIAHITQ
jgi:hypothetical protein